MYLFCIISSIWCHKIFSFFVYYTNFSGIAFCKHHIDIKYPTNISQVQHIVNTNQAIRAAGFGHSWNPYTCPNQSGIVIKMQELRKLEFVNDSFIAGGGTSMGSLVNFMMRHGQELPSFWVSDISIGGAISSGVHNDGIGFFECCVTEITIVNGLGNIVKINKNDSIWSFIPGSIGRLGIVVQVCIKGQPLSILQYITTKTYWSTPKDIIDSIHAFNKSSTLWITHNKIIKQDKLILGRHESLPNATYSFFPLQKQFVHQSIGRRFFASIFSSALTILPIISYHILYNNYHEFEKYAEDDNKDEIHYTTNPTYIEPNKPSRMKILKNSLIFSTIEIDITVKIDHLSTCLHVLLDPSVFFPMMHIRHAQNSVQELVAHGRYIHIDFSLPTWTLSRYSKWFRQINQACHIRYSHPGKATTELMEELRDNTDTKLINLPPQHENLDFRTFINLMDPEAKFAPLSRTGHVN